MIEPKTYKCYRCGKRFTKFGREAEVIQEMEDLLREYRHLVGDTDLLNRTVKTTTLEIIQYQARCCNNPLILHTYHERENI